MLILVIIVGRYLLTFTLLNFEVNGRTSYVVLSLYIQGTMSSRKLRQKHSNLSVNFVNDIPLALKS